MQDLETLLTPYIPPICIQVIGFGKTIAPIISEVNSLGYEEVSAYMADEGQTITPGEKDIMAIICVDGDDKTAPQISKTFYDANILTLVVSTKSLQEKGFDSVTEVGLHEMPTVVKSLLDPLFLNGQISFSFTDMATCLRNSRHFFIENATSKGKENRIGDALSKFNTSVPDQRLDSAGHISLILYYNPDLEPPLMIREISPLNEYLSHMPDNIDVIWAIFRDNKMPTDEIRLSVIVSGKNM